MFAVDINELLMPLIACFCFGHSVTKQNSSRKATGLNLVPICGLLIAAASGSIPVVQLQAPSHPSFGMFGQIIVVYFHCLPLHYHVTTQRPAGPSLFTSRLRNDLYCVEWDVKL